VAVFIELWQKTVELRRQGEQLRAQELAALERESEERYRFLGNSIPQQVWTALPDGNLDYVNERVLEFFGRTFAEMIGSGWSDVVHPEDLPACLVSWSEALESGDPYECEFRLRRGADDVWRWHLARAVPMRGADGEIVRWFGTNTDIDDRRTTEDRQRFLADAGWVLGSSLDYEQTLADVARLAVPRVADWCAVDIFTSGRLERLALEHADPLKVALARELQGTMLAASESAGSAAIQRHEPVLVPDVDEAALRAFGFDERQLEIAHALEPRSYVTVPLIARGEVIGTISLVTAESERTYGEDDLALAVELARHAAAAIDNARLYQEAERRGRAARVLDAVGDGVVLIDREGVIRLWNTAASTITGLGEDEVLGQRIGDVVPRWDEIGPRIPVASKPGSHVRAAAVPVEIGGRELWLSGSGVGFDEGTVYAFRDLTEERALEELKADFVATVSHELRTPLAAIYGAAQTVRRADLELGDDVRDELLGVVASESDRLADIVNDLLLASHLDSGRLPVSIERCDAVELATAVVETARAHLPERIELALEAPEHLTPVAADRGQLQQVLVNLVDNAIKYSPEGGRVELRLAEVDSRIRFAVSDEGLGIPPTEHRRIFEKFYRLDPHMTRGIGGTGLGLYICRELVRRMDGSLRVESQLGAGSTFVVELPAAGKPGTRRAPAKKPAKTL
jgi:PAS domain S-box-containing protein